MRPLVRRNIRPSCAFWVQILGLCVLGGCASSPQVQYFALEPVESHGRVLASAPTSVQVAQVHLPPALDRKQIVRHTGGYTLGISDQHRWGGPLDEMIRRVLSQDLLQVLPPDSVVLPEEPAPPGTRKIVVNILEFAPDATGMIQFEGTWSLITPDSQMPPQSRYIRLSAPAGANDITDQVKSMSDILDRLASSMASTLAESAK